MYIKLMSERHDAVIDIIISQRRSPAVAREDALQSIYIYSSCCSIDLQGHRRSSMIFMSSERAYVISY